jgi:hypothetical protein
VPFCICRGIIISGSRALCGSWPPLLLFRNQFYENTVALPGRVISPSQGLYLHRTTQHRKTKDKHPCPERDSNPLCSMRALNAHASDRTATGLAIFGRIGDYFSKNGLMRKCVVSLCTDVVAAMTRVCTLIFLQKLEHLRVGLLVEQ